VSVTDKDLSLCCDAPTLTLIKIAAAVFAAEATTKHCGSIVICPPVKQAAPDDDLDKS
jgi:hypothetical protein